MKRKLAIIAIIFVFLASGASLLGAPKKTSEARLPVFESSVEKKALPPAPSLSKARDSSSPLPDSVSTSTRESGIPVVLLAGSARYEDRVPEGSTAYDAMSTIAAKGTFRFRAKYFDGMGYFIEEMEGVKNSGGKYWTLYINDEYSMTGASGYEVKPGDTIEWRFEKR